MNLRICGNCGSGKSETDFNFKNKRLGARHSICKDCHASYKRAHYISNRQKYIEKARKWNGRQRLNLQNLVLKYLSTHACVDCGEADVAVLEFDHRGDKIGGIADMIKSSSSVARITAEIAKCDVRCANCHRRKTAKQFRHWKIILGA